MHGLSMETYNKIAEIIADYPKVEFKLFGSRATGKEKYNSDIDMAVLGRLEEQEIMKIRNDFDLLDIPYKIDLVFMESAEKQELKDAVLREGVSF